MTREPEDAAAPSRDGVLVIRAVARANGDQALFRITMGAGEDDVPVTSAAVAAAGAARRARRVAGHSRTLVGPCWGCPPSTGRPPHHPLGLLTANPM